MYMYMYNVTHAHSTMVVNNLGINLAGEQSNQTETTDRLSIDIDQQDITCLFDTDQYTTTQEQLVVCTKSVHMSLLPAPAF